MYNLVRQAVASLATVSACALSAFAYEPPPVFLSATNFPEWRDSCHLLVGTNRTDSGVQITLFIEKPPSPDIYWTLHLGLYEGTNMVAGLAVGTEVADAEVLRATGAKAMGVKALQEFRLFVSTNCLPQSTLTFSQRKIWPRNAMEAGDSMAPTSVPLRDVVNGATGPFYKSKPSSRR
jgi:hypothetical protein